METNSTGNEEGNEPGLVFRFFCWYYTWVLTPRRVLRWRVGFWYFARRSSATELEQSLRDYLEAQISISKPQLGEPTFLPWLKQRRIGLRAFWLADYMEARINNGGVGGMLYDARELGLLDEIAQALEFFEAKELLGLFAEARKILDQHFPGAAPLPPWSEFAQVMGFGVLEGQHDSLTTRCFDALQELSALRVAKVRQAPNLFD